MYVYIWDLGNSGGTSYKDALRKRHVVAGWWATWLDCVSSASGCYDSDRVMIGNVGSKSPCSFMMVFVFTYFGLSLRWRRDWKSWQGFHINLLCLVKSRRRRRQHCWSSHITQYSGTNGYCNGCRLYVCRSSTHSLKGILTQRRLITILAQRCGRNCGHRELWTWLLLVVWFKDASNIFHSEAPKSNTSVYPSTKLYHFSLLRWMMYPHPTQQVTMLDWDNARPRLPFVGSFECHPKRNRIAAAVCPGMEEAGANVEMWRGGGRPSIHWAERRVKHQGCPGHRCTGQEGARVESGCCGRRRHRRGLVMLSCWFGVVVVVAKGLVVVIEVFLGVFGSHSNQYRKISLKSQYITHSLRFMIGKERCYIEHTCSFAVFHFWPWGMESYMFEGGSIVLFILAHRWVSGLVPIFFDPLCTHVCWCSLYRPLTQASHTQLVSTL